MLISKSWDAWQADTYPEDEPQDSSSASMTPASSPPSSGTATPVVMMSVSSQSHSSRSEDVMKLPKKDMNIFGLCPVHDDFVLVICDICGRSVKIEAFSQHYRLRHGQNSINTSASKLTRSATAPSLRSSSGRSRVSAISAEFTSTSSSSSASSSLASTPNNSRASSVTTSSQYLASKSSAPSPSSIKEEPMDVDDVRPTKLKGKSLLKVKEEPSIINPLIKSSDLISMTNDIDINRIKNERKEVIKSEPQKASGGKKSKKSGNRGERKPLREYHPDKHCGVWDNDAKRNCTRALTCKSHSILLKRKIEGRSKSFDELVADHKAIKEAALKQGTLMPAPLPPPQPATTQNVTITPPNIEAVLNSITEPNPPNRNPINGIRNIPSGNWSSVPPVIPTATIQPGKVVSSKVTLEPQSLQLNGLKRQRETDENLHYSYRPPKPLALCNFGARRIGGILVADRNQITTRKIIKISIQNGSLKEKNRNNITARLQNVTQNNLIPRTVTQLKSVVAPMVQTVSSGTNFNIGTVKRTPGFSVIPGSIINSSVSRGVALNSITAANVGQPIVTNAVTGVQLTRGADGTFKTDIQDFRGGVKFEFGRQMKPISQTSDIS